MTFKIKEKKKETENKTIRFPIDLIDNIDMVLVNSNATFSSFVIQACEFALENLHQDKGEDF